ncbi:netrin receptor UNC5C-like [Homalodisca vitripennis]|nr:netrin receptor UNC5C-like [Homalodisca vitripennis]XP_046665433.1 netrin receptor UNC5C-like [Homalodisca vitripennis]
MLYASVVLCFCHIIITSSNQDVESMGEEDGLLDDALDLPFTSEHLPVFLEEPVDTYAMKNKPAVLYCRSAHALQVFFKCSGEAYHRLLPQQVFVDPETGVRVVETAINITRNMVEEYFGKDRFQCQCVAWSSRGEIESQPATVENAYLQRQFLTVPHPEKVEVDHQVEMQCLPPSGLPSPTVRWLRNGVPVEPDANVIISSEGHLLIGQARVSDSANYTCVAENVAAKRVTKPVLLLVYANGGWSPWTEWSDCPQHSCDVQQSRYRLCNKPSPHHGLPCPGASVETRECMDPDLCLVVDGQWSPWSEWSVCDIECKQYRARNCSQPAPSHNGKPCPGEGVQVLSCFSGQCKATKNKMPADLAMYTGFVVAVCVFTCVLLVIVFIMYYRRQQCTVHTAVVSDYYGGEEKSETQPDVTKTVLYMYSDIDGGRHKQYMLPHSDSLHHYDVPQLSPQSSSHWIVGNRLEDFEILKSSQECSLMSTFDQKHGL